MPDHTKPESEAPRSAASGVSLPQEVNLRGLASSSNAETDLSGLAALFATHGGGDLPDQLSADLALEIVLNEIVEQACLATGASGAAIALLRDGEMVCRASSGGDAPELGARLSTETGLTAECITTRQAQRCADAQADPRADMEASRNLGVRSVMILPLLRDGELLGVLEVFSSRPDVFGERDEVTLGALAERILKNLEQARAPLLDAKQALTAPESATISPPEWKDLPASPAPAVKEGKGDLEVDSDRRTPRRLDVVTVSLAAAIVLCALLLGTFLGVGLGWRKTLAVRRPDAKSGSRTAQTRTGNPGNTNPMPKEVPGSAAAENAMAAVPGKIESAGFKNSNDSGPPPGTLLVYENGKEVFRMEPAGKGPPKKVIAANRTGLQKAAPPGSEREAAEIVQLSPAAAEGNLLHRVEPDYPEEARQQGIQGLVVLDVRIGRDGAVQEVKLLSGQPLLGGAAMAAVKQWRFKQHMQAGHPVEMQTTVMLNFRMPT